MNNPCQHPPEHQVNVYDDSSLIAAVWCSACGAIEIENEWKLPSDPAPKAKAKAKREVGTCLDWGRP